MSNVGRVLYGYCGGFFGDSYHDKRIEAEGFDWIVARELDNAEALPEFADFSAWIRTKQKIIDEWATPPEDLDN